MENLSDTVERKFIETLDASDYEILTDTGWEDCVNLHKTVQYEIWKLETRNFELQCADNHIVFDENMNEIFVKDLKPGMKIYCEDGLDEVVSVQNTGISDNMYDVELGGQSNHRYYTNGILSHNTTTYTIYALWTLIFQPEKRIMLLANKADTALEIMSRIKLAWENLPGWIKPGIVVFNKGEIIFSNKSAIKGFATASDSARGYSANIVIMDEAAFVPNNIASKVFESIYPVISSSKNSQFIMVSTPNGADPNNLYYSIWQKANSKNKNNSEGWKAFRFDWWEVPGRDEQWKEDTVASIGERRFAQEFGNEFVASGTSHKLIPDDILERYRMKISEYKTKGIKPKKTVILAQTQDKAFEFEMWKGFDQTHTYMASADIAEGVGGDSSILYVWDVTDLSCIQMCAKFESNTVSTVEFAFVCNRILNLYGNPYLFAERNGISGAMLDSLRITYGYQNIARESKNGEPGIYSHITIKERAVLWCRDMMTTQGFGFEIYDKGLIDEFDTFVKKDNKGMHTIFTAASGAHDDMVMAFVWACWALNKEVIEKYFIVCSTFNTMYGDILPRSLQPIDSYSPDEINRITNDPIYKDFLEFRNQLSETAKQIFNNQRIEEKRDIYRYTDDDMYFGDQWDGPSWNTPGIQRRSINPDNMMPSFYIT